MLSSLLKRIRREKSQQRGAVLVPPDLTLRDSFGSSFPHVSEGGYRLYYELEWLNQKRTCAGAQTLPTTLAHKSIPVSSSSSASSSSPSSSLHPRVRVPVAPSRPRRLAPTIPPPSTSHRRRPTRPRRKAAMNPGLDRIAEAPPYHPNLRKEKKGENLHNILVADGMKINAEPFPSPRHWVISHSSPTSSSSGHSTIDTPPTTVEDLALDDDELVGAMKRFGTYNEERSCGNDDDDELHERPESWSSYYTARSMFSDQ